MSHIDVICWIFSTDVDSYNIGYIFLNLVLEQLDQVTDIILSVHRQQSGRSSRGKSTVSLTTSLYFQFNVTQCSH